MEEYGGMERKIYVTLNMKNEVINVITAMMQLVATRYCILSVHYDRVQMWILVKN